jgi:hypothetical protein
MKQNILFGCIVATLVLLFAATTASAHDVTIPGPSKLGNGPGIEEGTYRIELIKNQDSAEAVLYKKGDEVARAPVRVLHRDTISKQTEVHSEMRDTERIITQIRLKGSDEALLFERSGGGSE